MKVCLKKLRLKQILFASIFSYHTNKLVSVIPTPTMLFLTTMHTKTKTDSKSPLSQN